MGIDTELTIREAVQIEYEKTEALIDGFKDGRIPFKEGEYQELRTHKFTLDKQIAQMHADEEPEDMAPYTLIEEDVF